MERSSKRKNDSLIVRENTRLNQYENSHYDSFSTQPSVSENHVFDQDVNDLAAKHQLNIDVDDELLLSKQNTSLSNNESH